MSGGLITYHQGDDLKLDVKLDIYVLNLTSTWAGRHAVAATGLSNALDAVNQQVVRDFTPAWGSTGTLIDKTEEFAVHLTNSQRRGIESASPETVAAAITTWIHDHHSQGTIDWSRSALVYLTDLGSGNNAFAGVHEDSSVSHFDIPWAIVTVSNANWTVTLSHEVLELLADPYGNRVVLQNQYAVIGWHSQYWILEVCDAVEEITYQRGEKNVNVSDFVLPNYFDLHTAPTVALNFAASLGDPTKALLRGRPGQPVNHFPYPMIMGGYLSFFNEPESQFAQITWFQGHVPLYTNPQSAFAAALDHKRCHRLRKYAANFRAHRLHAHRVTRLHGAQAV
jgi:hypothetical protein